MKTLSILLGLSGSQASQHAAELSWELAKKTGGSVTAHHIVDTQTAWAFLTNERTGFIGSGLYIAAFEALRSSLQTLADKLTIKYKAVAEGQNIHTKTIISEGNPVYEISKEALDHDLVIVGHQAPNNTEPKSHQFIRYAIAEALSHYCPRPLIICQQNRTPWTRMKIFISIDHLNLNYINSCMRLATLFGLEPQLVCLTAGSHEEPVDKLQSDIQNADPLLKNVPIEVHILPNVFVEAQTEVHVHARTNLCQREPIQFSLDTIDEELVVIPTRAIAGKRITLLGTSSDEFIQKLNLANIMLWPEEYVLPKIEVGSTPIGATKTV